MVLSLLRLSAFKPIDRSWMVARVSLRRVQLATCDGVGRARVMRASFGQNNEKKADLTIVTKRQILRHPGLDLVGEPEVRS